MSKPTCQNILTFIFYFNFLDLSLVTERVQSLIPRETKTFKGERVRVCVCVCVCGGGGVLMLIPKETYTPIWFRPCKAYSLGQNPGRIQDFLKGG